MKTIGNYRLLHKLGEGGMGLVYLGEDLRTGSQVAVKIMKAEVSLDVRYISRFEREITVSKQFAHPYVIKIIDGGVIPESRIMYLIMEFLEADSLDFLYRKKRIKTAEARIIMLHMAEALSYIHERNIIHRDIKPDNILSVSPERTVLLDFGLSLAEDLTRISKTADKCGTWATMSPEQINGSKLDVRSDIYNLGVTLYWAMTGGLPYNDGEMIRIAIGTEPPIPLAPHKENPKIEEYLSSIVMKCFAFHRKDRFQSSEDLLKAIQDKEIVTVAQVLAHTQNNELVTSSSHTANKVELANRMKKSVKSRDKALVLSETSKSHLKTKRFFVAALIMAVAFIVVLCSLFWPSVKSLNVAQSERRSSNSLKNKSVQDANRSLKTLTNKLLSYEGEPSKKECKALGELLLQTMPTHVDKANLLPPMDMAGLYYLSIIGASEKKWNKTFAILQLFIERYGVVPVPYLTTIFKSSPLFKEIHSLERLVGGSKGYRIIGPTRRELSEIPPVVNLILYSARAAGKSRELVQFQRDILAKATSRSEKTYSIVALAWAKHRCVYSSQHYSTGAEKMVDEDRIKKMLEVKADRKNALNETHSLCEMFKKRYLTPDNLPMFTALYFYTLKCFEKFQDENFYKSDFYKEGLAFYEGWIEKEGISSVARMQLHHQLGLFVKVRGRNEVAAIFTGTAENKISIELEHCKKAMRIAEEINYPFFYLLAIRVGEAASDCCEDKYALSLYEELFVKHPDLAIEPVVVIPYAKLLRKNILFKKSRRFLERLLVKDYHEQQTFLSNELRQEIKKRIDDMKIYETQSFLKGL